MRYSFGNLPVSHKFALFNRNRKGKIVKPAPFQKSAVPGEVARVAPNRKWFGEYNNNIGPTEWNSLPIIVLKTYLFGPAFQ